MKHVVRQSSNRVLELDAVLYRSSGAERVTTPGRQLQSRFVVLQCSEMQQCKAWRASLASDKGQCRDESAKRSRLL